MASQQSQSKWDWSKQDWYAKLTPEQRKFLDETPEEITLDDDESEVWLVPVNTSQARKRGR